jgi:GNAT superfamily N-acetyltransferase
MELEYVSFNDVGLDRAADIMRRAFSDYVVKIEATPGTLQQMAKLDGVDFALSRVVLRDGDPVGVAFVARRGDASRLAGIALVPDARRQGIGRATVMRLVDEARSRGDRTMVLEVVEQNLPAVRLYESCGFARMRRLVGFRRPVQADNVMPRSGAPLREVDVGAVAAVVAGHGLPDLPWQLSGETLARLPPSTAGYALDGAWIAVTTPNGSEAGIRALVTERPYQGNGRGAALLRAVLAKYPDKEWKMSAIWPDELAAVFLEAGFSRLSMTQWQMGREFA